MENNVHLICPNVIGGKCLLNFVLDEKVDVLKDQMKNSKTKQSRISLQKKKCRKTGSLWLVTLLESLMSSQWRTRTSSTLYKAMQDLRQTDAGVA